MAYSIQNMAEWLHEHQDDDWVDSENGNYWVPMVALRQLEGVPHDEWVTIREAVHDAIHDLVEDANIVCWVISEYNDCDKCEYFGIGWDESPADAADNPEDDDE